MTNILARSTNSIIEGPKSAKKEVNKYILIAITLDDSSKSTTMMIEKQPQIFMGIKNMICIKYTNID